MADIIDCSAWPPVFATVGAPRIRRYRRSVSDSFATTQDTLAGFKSAMARMIDGALGRAYNTTLERYAR